MLSERRLVIKLMFGAAGNIVYYGPVLAERANVVIELFVIYKADYSLHNSSIWWSRKFQILLKMFFVFQ